MRKSQIPNPKSQVISNDQNPKYGLEFGVWNLGFIWNLVLGNWNFRQGFTLLEMVISIGIFSVLVTAAIGITIGVSNAYLKSANVQATQDNIRFSVELMTKELRTGSQYALSASCASRRGEEISFVTAGGERRVYYLSGTTLMRLAGSGGCGAARPLLADEVNTEGLRFAVGGEAAGPSDGQPWVMIALAVRSRSGKQPLESRMDLQTTVVQRLRDL